MTAASASTTTAQRPRRTPSSKISPPDTRPNHVPPSTTARRKPSSSTTTTPSTPSGSASHHQHFAASRTIPPTDPTSFTGAVGWADPPPHPHRPLRTPLRTLLLPRILAESHAIARAQAHPLCTPTVLAALTALGALGTHAAFMLLLPPLFWVGGAPAAAFGRGVVVCLLGGVWASAVVKDYFCLPRPLAPPVHRLTSKRSIALEYGFPSTHTMNAVSIAAHAVVQMLAGEVGHPVWRRPGVGGGVAVGALGAYAVAMGVSRMLTGMHSAVDVAGGAVLGAVVVAGWWGGLGRAVETWIATGGIEVPVMAVVLLVLAIYIHPDPAAACPCFEDSVAAISVVAGVIVGAWHHGAPPVDAPALTPVTIFARLVFGVATVYAFRKVAKTVCRRVLRMVLREDACQGEEGKREGGHVRIRKVTVETVTDGVVYGGIGFVAVDVVPWAFRRLGI
ncbi:hypothetical protein HDU96_002681 [Phlyctochytrium bullatum]|nr:hypothetical protein HDU96_002681 [Phlyctochytrium bullatum]